MWKKWEDLPHYMQVNEVRPYYEILNRKRVSLILKRVFDFIFSIVLLVILLPVMVGISIAIVADSKGGIFFRQERVTQYGRKFCILKFRTMVVNAEKLGAKATAFNDIRITKIGKVLRKYRLDELPQIINIIVGEMSFVGTRPEVPQFVKAYTSEMFATLLLPAGVTSETSIQYKDEELILEDTNNIEEMYVSQILPIKMKYNLMSIQQFSLMREIDIMIRTIFAVIR